MKPVIPKPQRCAIYTRKSTEHNLDLAFNSLDAQREACEAYIKSQAHEGWRLSPERYDDGGLSGASLERPALQMLLQQVRARKLDIIVVYKVDRLTRSLADFAKLVEVFDEHGVSFVSVTQSFNTTSSMGRLTLNVLLSFAQFEREVIGERVRDKIAASTAPSDLRGRRHMDVRASPHRLWRCARSILHRQNIGRPKRKRLFHRPALQCSDHRVCIGQGPRAASRVCRRRRGVEF
jgi:DNA invertase Pin-like site-specific DNA recombinase